MSAANSYPDIAAAVTEAQKVELTDSARAGLGQADYLGSVALYGRTGIPASTWRYWAMNNIGPRSFKLGRRRVWRWSDVEAWIAAQEAVTATGGAP